MKLSWTETGHQGIVNFSLSLSSSLLLSILPDSSFEYSSRRQLSISFTVHLFIFGWDCNLRTAYYVTFSSPELCSLKSSECSKPDIFLSSSNKS